MSTSFMPNPPSTISHFAEVTSMLLWACNHTHTLGSLLKPAERERWNELDHAIRRWAKEFNKRARKEAS